MVAIGFVACSFDSAGVGSGDGDGGPQTSGSASDGTTLAATTAGTSTGDPTLSTTAVDASTDGGTSSTGHASSEGSDEHGSSSTGETGEPPSFGPFDNGTPVVELNSNFFDDDPTLRGDLREIYFASLRLGGPGAEDIWRSQRASVDDPWDDPTVVDGINAAEQDGWPELSHDGLWMSFGSDRAGGEGSFDVYVVGRADFDSPWSPPVHVDELSSNQPEAAAVTSADMLEVLLTSPIPYADDILRATRDNVATAFGPLALVDELNSIYRDSVPFLDIGGTRVLFASDRPGTDGQMAIWTAVREPGMAFGPPEQVTDVDAAAYAEDDPWWAPDGSVLYFARMSGLGELDIYVAHQSGS